MLLTLVEKVIDCYFAIIPRVKPSVSRAHEAKLCAHRGAHQHAQGVIENTIPAFNLAETLGCWGIEFDVHTTADKVLVVNHDPDLKRLWGQDVNIADVHFDELRALEPRIPSLAEVVAQFSKSMHLFIELKAPFRGGDALIEVLKELTPIKDYHLIVLDSEVLKQLTSFPSEALMLVPVHNNVTEFCNLSIKEQYGGLLGNYLLLTKSIIGRLQRAHQSFGVGFVESKFSLYRELNRGISLIFTNSAENVSHHLKSLRKNI